MTHIETCSGRKFPVTAPTPDDISIAEIAVALSRCARFNGMTAPHLPAYSVAQHAVRVSLAVPPADAMWGLLHDAAEAYIGDIASPVKQLLADVIDPIEDKILAAVVRRFGLAPEVMPETVKRADAALLVREARDLMVDGSWARRAVDELDMSAAGDAWRGLDLTRPLPADDARHVFLLRFAELEPTP